MTDFCNLCRRLANRERLNLLRKAMLSPEPDGLPAAHYADMTWLSPATARQHLRVLEEECGLIESVRDGHLVSFRVRRDSDDPRLRRLIPSLIAFFREEGRGGCDMNGAKAPDPAFAKLLLPLSDASRVHLLRVIRDEGPLKEAEIRNRCGLSAEDMKRHCCALAESGLVVACDQGVTFVEPSDPLSRLFVSLALNDESATDQ